MTRGPQFYHANPFQFSYASLFFSNERKYLDAFSPLHTTELQSVRLFCLYSLSERPFLCVRQSFITTEVCRDRTVALAPSCKKRLTGFFNSLLFFLKVKYINKMLKDMIKLIMNRNLWSKCR